jgi:membrane dipeptidase
MIRRIAQIVAILLLLAGIGFFGFAPPIAEADRNKVIPAPLPSISAQTRALHARLQIADLHGDTLLWRRSLLDRADRGQIDLPRLLQGNVALQVFSSVTKTPKGHNYDSNPADSDSITLLTIAQLQPPKTWHSLLERALFHARKLDRAASGSEGKLRVIYNPAELDRLLADRAAGARVVGGMLALEGLHPLEGQLANLDRLHAAGFRMAGLVHHFDNEVAGSMHGVGKGGLTPLGVQVVARMERIGMVIDLAHASHATVAQVLRIATRPVVSSHGGVQATCQTNRNLSDAEIRGIAATGGVIGIGYWDAAVCSTAPAEIARAIAHVRDLVGIDHVGLGSDFDGAVTTGFDTAQLVAVTQALVDRGFSEAEVAKVMGGNVLRVLRAGVAPQP